MPRRVVIGLEIHAQLRTRNKLFCACENQFGAPANSLVCPVCLGYPGTLPWLNPEAVDLATRLAVALGCELAPLLRFDRKNYFYPDLPKGYQITQKAEPLGRGGSLPLNANRKIALRGLHLEEDSGRLRRPHPQAEPTHVDFNRAGAPLVEVVTEPVMHHVEEAVNFARAFRRLLLFTETSKAILAHGHMRVDANISLADPQGVPSGTQVELKNLNSFRQLKQALTYEVTRQTKLLEPLKSETRGFDPKTRTTFPLRTKEKKLDYRFFPEPDLPPFHLDSSKTEILSDRLPWNLERRWIEHWSLNPEEAEALCSTPELAQYFEAAAALAPHRAPILPRWICQDLKHCNRDRGLSLAEGPTPQQLVDTVTAVESGKLSPVSAKRLLRTLSPSSPTVPELLARGEFGQIDNEGDLVALIHRILMDNKAALRNHLRGKEAIFSFFMGEIMRATRGQANPARSRELLHHSIDQLRNSDFS